MKKRLFLLFAAVIAVSAMTACSLTEMTEPIKDEVNDMMPDNKEDAKPQMPESQMPDANKQEDAKQTQSQKPDTASFIGEEKAKEIALKKAGLTKDGVTFSRTELDLDDGVWKYEIEFKKDGTEYDAEIKANDGTILSWETDKND